MNFKVGDIVTHKTFGEGVVSNISEFSASVDFYNFGKKTITYEFLKIADNSGNKKSETSNYEKITFNTVSMDDLVYLMIKKIWKSNTDVFPILDCYKVCQDIYSKYLDKAFIVKSLQPINGYVSFNHLEKIRKKIRKGQIENEVFVFNRMLDVHNQDLELVKVSSIRSFEQASLEEDFTCTAKLLFARAIIDFCITKNEDKSGIYIFKLTDIASYIFNQYLFQLSFGEFINDQNNLEPPFYDLIHQAIRKKDTSNEISQKAILEIRKYLKHHVIRQFLIVNNRPSNEIYKYNQNFDIEFDESFVELVKENGDSLDKRIITRMIFFLQKNNGFDLKIKTYSKNLSGAHDKKPFEIHFEFEEKLEDLKKILVEDLYLKKVFIKKMEEVGIPYSDANFKTCLNRLDYFSLAHGIVLHAIYPNLKSYLKESIGKNDVYRYSNPYNLDEYNRILKNLVSELFILEVGNGLYTTRTNMEKNGVNEKTIATFKKEVINFGCEMSFFSLKELTDSLNRNPIVEYCNGDEKQLLQFVSTIKSIKIVSNCQTGTILSFSNSKNYKGDFIEFLMGDKDSSDIYDIHDFVKSVFGVEYPIEDIIKDISQTSFYYSEEMEKIYKTKEVYIKEIYYNGN